MNGVLLEQAEGGERRALYELSFSSVGRAAGKPNTSPPFFPERYEVAHQLGVMLMNGLRHLKSCEVTDADTCWQRSALQLSP